MGGWGGEDSAKTILPKSVRNNKLWVIQWQVVGEGGAAGRILGGE